MAEIGIENIFADVEPLKDENISPNLHAAALRPNQQYF
jgi:hypothetical protein